MADMVVMKTDEANMDGTALRFSKVGFVFEAYCNPVITCLTFQWVEIRNKTKCSTSFIRYSQRLINTQHR